MQDQPTASRPQFGLRFLFALIAVLASLFGTWRLLLSVTPAVGYYVLPVWAYVPALAPMAIWAIDDNGSRRPRFRAAACIATGVILALLAFLWSTERVAAVAVCYLSMLAWIVLSIAALSRRVVPVTVVVAMLGSVWLGTLGAFLTAIAKPFEMKAPGPTAAEATLSVGQVPVDPGAVQRIEVRQTCQRKRAADAQRVRPRLGVVIHACIACGFGRAISTHVSSEADIYIGERIYCIAVRFIRKKSA